MDVISNQCQKINVGSPNSFIKRDPWHQNECNGKFRNRYLTVMSKGSYCILVYFNLKWIIFLSIIFFNQFVMNVTSLVPVDSQAIACTNSDLLSIGHFGTSFSDFSIKMQKKKKNNHQQKCIWKCGLWTVGNFVQYQSYPTENQSFNVFSYWSHIMFSPMAYFCTLLISLIPSQLKK